MGVCVPEEYGGAGADFLSLHPRARGALARRRRRGRHGRRAHERRARCRSSRSEPTSSARASCRRSRAARSSARSRSPSPSPAPTRARFARAQSPTATAGASPARSSGSRTARYAGDVPALRAHRPRDGRRARRLRVRARRRARPHHARGGEARAQLVGARTTSSSRARSSAATGSLHEEGKRLPRRDGDARRRPHRHRRAGARHRAGGLRRRARVREGAPHVRQARSPSTRRSSGSSRTWRPRSTPRACSSTAPRG